MAFSKHHLENTTELIINLCLYSNGTPLERSDKKQASEKLLQIFQDLAAENPHKIVLTASHQRFESFFAFLSTADICFPDKTDFILKREGVTKQRHNNIKKRIYEDKNDKQEKKAERTKNTLSDLEEQLACLSTNDDSEDMSSQGQTDLGYTPLRRAFPLEAFIVDKTSDKKSTKKRASSF